MDETCVLCGDAWIKGDGIADTFTVQPPDGAMLTLECSLLCSACLGRAIYHAIEVMDYEARFRWMQAIRGEAVAIVAAEKDRDDAKGEICGLCNRRNCEDCPCR